MDCLEQSLRKRRSRNLVNMDKFVVYLICFGRNERVFLDKCLCYVIAKKLKTLHLVISYSDVSDGVYNLPSTVLCSDSLEVLYIRGCIVRLPRSVLKPSPLKILDMKSVDMDDGVLESVLLCCPFLEELHIHSDSELKTLNLFDHEKLRVVDISGCVMKKVDINLLNVTSLSVVQHLRFKTFVINITNYANIKKLILQRAVMNADRLGYIITELLHLEWLSLKFCNIRGKLSISSASLQILETHNWETHRLSHWQGFSELEIDSPNLSFFYYYGDMIPVCSNAWALSMVKLKISALKTIDNYMKFAEFLKGIHGCSERLILDGFEFTNEVIDAAKKLRQTLPPPLFRCPHVEIHRSSSLDWLGKAMDEFLWICPHVTTLLTNGNKLLIKWKFSYKRQLMYEAECCQSYPLLCWEQCIDKVEIQLITKFDCGEEFSSEGHEFWKAIDKLGGLRLVSSDDN